MSPTTKTDKRIRLISRVATLSLVVILLGTVIAPQPLLDPVKGHSKAHKWTKVEVKRWTKLLWHTTKDQWNCLDKLNIQESQWSWTMRNPRGGAYGIAQALPPTKYNVISTDWKFNPMTQVVWQKKYIETRYHDKRGVGMPCYALKHERQRGWY
jgi:hypothetical protein